MDTGRSDAWTRRRFGLGVSGLAAGLLVVSAGGETAAKRKKKKKPSPPRCSQVCGPSAGYCAYRVRASTLCVETYSYNCDRPCSSDQECIGNPAGAYCVSTFVQRSDGTRLPTIGPGGGCEGFASTGVCAQLFPPN